MRQAGVVLDHLVQVRYSSDDWLKCFECLIEPLGKYTAQHVLLLSLFLPQAYDDIH